MNGSPLSPGGQRHIARWFSAWHVAVLAHGFDTVHGLTHCLLRQVSVVAHSSLLLHPGCSCGATNKNNTLHLKSFEICTEMKIFLLIKHDILLFF
jgi:hypothetical protein